MVIRSITQYFAKCKQNKWFLRPPYASSSVPNQIAAGIKDLEPPRKLNTPSPKTDHNQLVLDHIEKIGKGSAFHRKIIQGDLKALGVSALRRAKNINEQQAYPEEQARVVQEKSKHLKSEVSQVLKVLDQDLAQEIIALLVELTPKPANENELSPIAINDTDYKIENHLPNDVYSEVYPIPAFNGDPLIFEHYVYLLTHSTFHYKKSSSFNGVIPKILRNLFHPLNENTIKLRTANSYNHLIHYFSSNWDIATCREYLVQMKLENINPTTTTYNIMFKSLLTLQNLKHKANPYKIALKHLDRMKSYNLDADVVTWNLIFKLLKDDSSKAMLLKQRSSLNIPIDHHSSKDIIQFLVLKKDVKAAPLISLLKEFEIPVDNNLLNILVKKLISEQQIDTAYRLILASKNLTPPVEPMNILLTRFAKIGRVDLVIATLNTFRNKFDVKPNFASYNLVMKSFSQSGQWNQKYEVWRVLYKRMLEDLDGVIAGTYWVTRLRSRLKCIYGIQVQLSHPLNEKELKLRDKIDQLVLDDEHPIPLIITDETPESYKGIAKYVGSRSYKSKRKSSSKNLEEKKKAAESYRRRIDKLGVQKAMSKRIPYAEDKFSALEEELTARNLTK